MTLYTDQGLFNKVVNGMRQEGYSGKNYTNRDQEGTCLGHCAKGLIMAKSDTASYFLIHEEISHNSISYLDWEGWTIFAGHRSPVELFSLKQRGLLDQLECLYAGWGHYKRNNDRDTSYWEQGFQEIAELFNLVVPAKRHSLVAQQTSEIKQEIYEAVV